MLSGANTGTAYNLMVSFALMVVSFIAAKRGFSSGFVDGEQRTRVMTINAQHASNRAIGGFIFMVTYLLKIHRILFVVP
jgi:hypothetical protein